MKLRTLAWRRYSECCGGLRDAAVLPAGGPAPIRLLLGVIFNTPFLLLQMHTLAVCKTLAKQARRRQKQSETCFATSIAWSQVSSTTPAGGTVELHQVGVRNPMADDREKGFSDVNLGV